MLLALPASAADSPSDLYVVRQDHWSGEDEQGYRDFVAAIGKSDCASLDACLKSPANPFRDTDRAGYVFQSDCADLPYVLRFYYAWKRGLPFSYVSDVRARGATRDIRYSPGGNAVSARTQVPSGVLSGYAVIEKMRAAVSSATYRLHPDGDEGDFYSPRIAPGSIAPGTVVYDPAGHVGIVYEVDDGRIRFFDAHTDYSLTSTTYDVRFARDLPSVGAGFKNWRPIRLVGARTQDDGSLHDGHVALAANADIADFSDEQFYGNGARPADSAWKSGIFTLHGEQLDFYDYVRARLAGDTLEFDPVAEIREMVRSNCADLHYRAQAVDLALKAGLQERPQPAHLPENIYGSEGDWEIYSTPSRDARLKTAFKYLRDQVQRFVAMDRRKDPHLVYWGKNLVADLLMVYRDETNRCSVTYIGSDGAPVKLSYEEARARLFAMSFDPYHCAERRWGAREPDELARCRDDAQKQAWYDAEQSLRNRIERSYGVHMGYSLAALVLLPAPAAPDTDVVAYLESQMAESAP
ncbi:MAG: hypothetical protein JOZ13_03315 [Alphaproteobacteria bacterium]|nr:hypothetical protein [Alphaproteobacteria bacterium]